MEAYSPPEPSTGVFIQTFQAPPPPYTDAPPQYSEIVKECHITDSHMGPPQHTATRGLNSGSFSGQQQPYANVYYQQQPGSPQSPSAAYGFQQPTLVCVSQQQTTLYGSQIHTVQAVPNSCPPYPPAMPSSHGVAVQTAQTGATCFMPGPATTTSQMIETTNIGRRKTLTHVTDLNTGKEYNIVKKQSRGGRRSKEIISEVGGPTTVIKQTPFRTVIRHK
ncbi:hypothetical protein Btru_001568 [Bulinus truncatus]|nr:hypothetical protein Btru_001568 [Bulinus truncatus]